MFLYFLYVRIQVNYPNYWVNTAPELRVKIPIGLGLENKGKYYGRSKGIVR
jgi:hypothetical protein